MSKKIFIIITPILIIVILAVIFHSYLPFIKQKPTENLSTTQEKIITATKSSAFDITYATPDISISGTINQSQDFQGSISLSEENSVGEIIKVKDTIYTQSSSEKPWQVNEPAFEPISNIITHPEYIQIKDRLNDLGNDFQYSVLFEKPNQKVFAQMSKEQLDNLRLTGTILVDKTTYRLKQMKLHQGTDISKEITIDYTVNGNPAVIAVPVK